MFVYKVQRLLLAQLTPVYSTGGVNLQNDRLTKQTSDHYIRLRTVSQRNVYWLSYAWRAAKYHEMSIKYRC